ncbi:NADH-quinone oxidoreductase subunit A [Candidatus Blochmannia sp. SNP]|uniref:NADH-quinone oxidoreductase subunit A n=1 Tax=Candidatus Blochmannia sp. SNP TaxID=3118169 RepID=UPI002F956616
MLLCGYFLGGRSDLHIKNVPFESGIGSVGDARIRFSVKFYLIAMVFVVFDIEGIYVYVWAVSIRDVGWMGFSEIFIFIFVLLASLVYLVRIGMFDWTEQSMRYENRVNNFDFGTTKRLKNSTRKQKYEIYFNDS